MQTTSTFHLETQITTSSTPEYVHYVLTFWQVRLVPCAVPNKLDKPIATWIMHYTNYVVLPWRCTAKTNPDVRTDATCARQYFKQVLYLIRSRQNAVIYYNSIFNNVPQGIWNVNQNAIILVCVVTLLHSVALQLPMRIYMWGCPWICNGASFMGTSITIYPAKSAHIARLHTAVRPYY